MSTFSFGNAISRRSFVKAGMGACATSALLGVSGCGSTQQAQSDLTPITFVLDYTPNTNHTGIYVAQEKGYFTDEGIQVTIEQPPDSGSDAVIGSGAADMGVTYQDYMANSFGSSAPMPYTAVAAVIQHNTSGIMSRAEDNIERPRDMAGHTYATWNLPVELAMVKSVVEKDGGDFSQVSLVPLETDDEVSGLKANMFDSVWCYEAWAIQNASVQGLECNYFSFRSIDSVFDYYTPVIAVNDSFASANGEAVRGFLRAVKKGYEFAVDNPSEAAKILLSAVPELDEALVTKSQQFLTKYYIGDASAWGVIDESRWSAFYQWLNDNDLVENQIDPKTGFTMEYLDA